MILFDAAIETKKSPFGFLMFACLGISLLCAIAAFILKKRNRKISLILIGCSGLFALLGFGFSFPWTKLATEEDWAWQYIWSIALFILAYACLLPGIYFKDFKNISIFLALGFFVLIILAITFGIMAATSKLDNVTDLSASSSGLKLAIALSLHK